MKVIDTIGPNSYSPGDIIVIPADGVAGELVSCQKHETVAAVAMLIGECDRMGSEVTTMCNECHDDHKEHVKNNPQEYERRCEQCGSTDNVRAKRDPDEGMAGPLYMWCRPCRQIFDRNYAENYNPDTDYGSEDDYYR